MRPRIHFDGTPNLFTAMRKLFNETSTLRQKPEYAKPVDRKFRLWRGGQVTGQRRWAA